MRSAAVPAVAAELHVDEIKPGIEGTFESSSLLLSRLIPECAAFGGWTGPSR